MKGERWILIRGLFNEMNFNCEILVVYAPNTRVERKQLWDELVDLRGGVTAPLMVMGDFNEVRREEERSGATKCLGGITKFTEWSNQMMIDDIPLVGRKFTWARGSSRSRLDRIFFDHDWGIQFSDAILRALPNLVSDHSPIILTLLKANQVPDFQPFRSMDMWFCHARIF